MRRNPVLLIALALGIGAIWLGVRQFGLTEFLDHRTTLTAFIDAWRWPALAAFVALYATVVALALPAAALFTLVGGVLFGALAGGLAAVTGATLGAILIFLAARTLFADYFAAKSGPWLAGIKSGFEADAASYLLMLRLAPVFPFALVNIAGALLGSPLGTFVWTTALGIVPGTFAYASVGAGLGDVLDAKAAELAACRATGRAGCTVSLDSASLLSPTLIAALIALALLAGLSIVLRRIWRRRGAQATES